MDIRQLEILDMLVSQKSFQKAARHCFVSTSTLTRQITALETELGFPLFERSAAGVALTEQGRVFYRETRGILQLYESAVSNARKAQKNQRNIRVAVYGYTRNRITRICEELKAHDENLSFSFVSCRVGESLSALLKHRIDVSLLADIQDADERFFTVPYFQCHNAVVVSDRHPLADRESVSLQELDGQTILIGVQQMGRKNYRSLKKQFDEYCPNSRLLDYQQPEQADAMCQLNGYLIESLSALEPQEGFRTIRIENAQKVEIGAVCMKEDEIHYRSLMENCREYFITDRSPSHPAGTVGLQEKPEEALRVDAKIP